MPVMDNLRGTYSSSIFLKIRLDEVNINGLNVDKNNKFIRKNTF